MGEKWRGRKRKHGVVPKMAGTVARGRKFVVAIKFVFGLGKWGRLAYGAGGCKEQPSPYGDGGQQKHDVYKKAEVGPVIKETKKGSDQNRSGGTKFRKKRVVDRGFRE